jgi:hypothetical protein
MKTYVESVVDTITIVSQLDHILIAAFGRKKDLMFAENATI